MACDSTGAPDARRGDLGAARDPGLDHQRLRNLTGNLNLVLACDWF